MEKDQTLAAVLKKEEALYDEKEGMVTRVMPPSHGYHTTLTGTVHHIQATSCFALCALLSGREELRPKALRAFGRICDLQDTRPESRTFGLWSYYLEQPLDEMIAPDYNWANFVGKDLLAACILCRPFLPDALCERMRRAVDYAARCTIRRNVGEDYTNIAFISCMMLVSAGELLGEESIFDTGKERLARFLEYTRVTTGFSEYNSAPYMVVALEEVTRMLLFFRDAECRKMAEELNDRLWMALAEHYNTALGQLSPPQARAYADVDTGRLATVIFIGTGGRYGKYLPESLDPDTLCYVQFRCPEAVLPLFEREEAFLAHTYYHKNTIRRPDADVTIIRELDSPDLTAYTYKTPQYSMGVFALCDTWCQRRNAMVIWDREHPKTFRLRGMHDDYDFCSGMCYARQNNNDILGMLGLVTDRGSLHYILDPNKTGIYEAEKLWFCFELGGESKALRIQQEGSTFYVDDGNLHIRLHIRKWMYDGTEKQPYLSEDDRTVILPGYDGPRKRLDTRALDDTYGIFTLSVRMGQTPQWQERLPETEYLPGGWIEARWNGLRVKAPRGPVPYRRALGLDLPDKAELEEKTRRILERIREMEPDGSVRETCPISIISMDAWEWPQGVALFAMFQYYRDCGDESVLSYLTGWFDRQIRKGPPEQNINTTCPMLTLAFLYEKTKNQAYLPLLKQWAEGVMHRLPRTREQGLQHIVSGNRNDNQLWDDTLYMTVLFLAKMGRLLDREDYVQESVRQFLVHIKYLTDVKSGLFFHGWTFDGCHHFANALWGRGNSWYTAGLVDYLECLDGVPPMEGVREYLLGTLLRQAQALAACQSESGLWHTLLDDSDSYLETSASSAFAYGILKAVRKGFLPGRFAQVGERAVRGVLEQITPDGTVQGVSYGTPVFGTLQEYKDVPICPMPYGQSMALLMLVEARRLTQTEKEK